MFITAIAPTAIASPIIINLLNGKMEFTVISILLTPNTLFVVVHPVVISKTREVIVKNDRNPVSGVLNLLRGFEVVFV